MFIHVPKNGGTSVKRALYKSDPGHASLRYYRLFFPSYLARAETFAIIREPTERFLSGYDFLMNGGGRTIGAGTHTRMFWDDYQAGKLDAAELVALEARMTRAPGTCNTMGTASTMTALVEAMGLALPGSTSIPAMDSAHIRMATDCGERIVGMVWEDLKPSRLLTRGSFQNAMAVQMALGGSTNAAVHIIAMARRAGIALTLADLDVMGRRVPVLAGEPACPSSA